MDFDKCIVIGIHHYSWTGSSKLMLGFLASYTFCNDYSILLLINFVFFITEPFLTEDASFFFYVINQWHKLSNIKLKI
jgi:hypothetical protein